MKSEGSRITKTRPQYTAECKAKAVRLVLAQHSLSHKWPGKGHGRPSALPLAGRAAVCGHSL
jgi:hypothetical protein